MARREMKKSDAREGRHMGLQNWERKAGTQGLKAASSCNRVPPSRQRKNRPTQWFGKGNKLAMHHKLSDRAVLGEQEKVVAEVQGMAGEIKVRRFLMGEISRENMHPEINICRTSWGSCEAP